MTKGRVLAVGMTNSIHLARLCASINRNDWDVLVFPCHDLVPHPDLKDVVLFDPTGSLELGSGGEVEVRPTFPWSGAARHPQVRALALAAVVARLRPSLVHAHQLQHGAYLATAARRLSPRFPPLIASIWGSDIALEGRLPEERPRIVAALRRVDVLTADCERDLRRARVMGFAGETVLPMPAAGGFDLEHIRALRRPGPTSRRRTIALKGYHGWAGRSQVALRAIAMCSDILWDYTVAVYSAHGETAQLAERMASELPLDVRVVTRWGTDIPHDDILALHGRSRISIGLSIVDGLSLSFLESMAMGSFPIQSDTGCAQDWISDGVSGLIVPAEDPTAVADAIRVAVGKDDLVDRAAHINDAVVNRRLARGYLQSQLMNLYDRTARGHVALLRN